MHITGVVTCVDYAERLVVGLQAWKDGLDEIVVVTSPDDVDTERVCETAGCAMLRTEAFYADGADFNKASAIDFALSASRHPEWILLFDADVIPPALWREVVEEAMPDAGCLYGCRRVDERGFPIFDGEIAGFFQLWHSQDPRWLADPRVGSWRSAAAYDTALMLRWPDERRRFIERLRLRHVGEPGRNWCGVGSDDARQRLAAERVRLGGWTHERLR